MKRLWITWPIVGGVIVLLTIFLVLQYRWQAKASEAEREIMQKRVEADTRQFAEDFNREIQAAYFNFQMDSEAWKASDWNQFNERYDYWRSKTEYPDLIRDFYFLKEEAGEGLRYDREKRTFSADVLTDEVVDLKKLAADNATSKPIYANQLALVLQIRTSPHKIERIRIPEGIKPIDPAIETPKREGYLIVLLDRSVIESKLLPDLSAKHFPDGDFRVDVKDKDQNSVFQTAGDVDKADATDQLLTISPENQLFFVNKDMLPRSAERHSSMVINQSVESRTFGHATTESNSTKTFTFELNSDGPKKRTAVFTSVVPDGEGWALGVQHISGSVDAFVSSEQNRKMMTGVAIYFLVIGAIIAIAYSAMRSQKFAQRQIDFVSSVSHEFRTPLAVIYSAGENLADGVAKDVSQVERYGALIKGEGKKLSAMVEQILEFAGARAGQRKFNFATADLNEIVLRTLAESGSSLLKDGFVIEQDLSNRLPTINADSEALSSAFQNLLQNAVKYSNGDRRIHVSTRSRKGCVAVELTDNGIGISDSDINKIFEPFYRAKDVVDAQIHGNGLGLSLVKEIVEAHGGTVYAESEKGKGSKFTIELPVE